MTLTIRLSDVFLPSFHDWKRAVDEGEYLKYVLSGGRGSGKSSHVAMQIILDVIEKPITALCVRKVQNTIQESCFEQLKEAMDILQVSHLFKINLNPLKITYVPRGNSIIFRGADDPNKIKSIKMSKFPIAILWIEELSEFKLEDEVSVIEKSILRAKLPEEIRYKFFYTYNPPKRKQNWVNKKFGTIFIPSNVHVHKSTYLENKFLSKEFIEEAEQVKETNPKKYDWEYLGKPIGSGVVPFDNLLFRQIDNEEILDFDNIRQGLDWGYSIDPLCMGRMHFDKKRRRLYIFGEIYGVKIGNRQLSDTIVKRGWDDVEIIADKDVRAIAELKELGIRIKSAKKPPGSREAGENWLDELDGIIIDPVRCPNIAREFESIDYATDRDGDTIARLEDKDDHSIDMTRYAMSGDMGGSRYSFK